MACSSLDESIGWLDLVYTDENAKVKIIKHKDLNDLKEILPNAAINEIRTYIWYEPADKVAKHLGIGHKKIMFYTPVGAFMTDRIGSCIRITQYIDAGIISNELKLNNDGYVLVKSFKSSKNLHNFIEKLKKYDAKLVREPYNLITNNCLHYANKITKSLGE